MINIQNIINQVVEKFGIRGCLIAMDTIPPFMLPFDYPIMEFKETHTAKWDSFGTPGARIRKPAFAGMEDHKITFKAIWDLANPNNNLYLNQIDISAATSGEATPYKGAYPITTRVEQAAGIDYIARVKSALRVLKSPKNALQSTKLASSGKLLRVSQGSSDPNPPLCLFLKNPTEMFLCYVTVADVEELDSDDTGFITRIIATIELTIVPDFVLTTRQDAIDYLNILQLTLGV